MSALEIDITRKVEEIDHKLKKVKSEKGINEVRLPRRLDIVDLRFQDLVPIDANEKVILRKPDSWRRRFFNTGQDPGEEEWWKNAGIVLPEAQFGVGQWG